MPSTLATCRRNASHDVSVEKVSGPYSGVKRSRGNTVPAGGCARHAIAGGMSSANSATADLSVSGCSVRLSAPRLARTTARTRRAPPPSSSPSLSLSSSSSASESGSESESESTLSRPRF